MTDIAIYVEHILYLYTVYQTYIYIDIEMNEKCSNRMQS